MYEESDLVRYSRDYILSNYDKQDWIVAAIWRGRVIEVINIDSYVVVSVDDKDEVRTYGAADLDPVED